MSIEKLKTYYIHERIVSVDKDFLSFEEQNTSLEDINLMLKALSNNCQLTNPNNSILLYVTGLSNEFDHKLARCKTRGGAPPDIDVDYSSKDIYKMLNWLDEYWGPGHSAAVATYGKLKPKSITRRFFSATTPKPYQFATESEYKQTLAAHIKLQKQIEDKIPKPLYGFEPTIDEMIEGNEKKNYKPQPELKSDPKYAPWLEAAQLVEGLYATEGAHAGAVVVHNEPLINIFPMKWGNIDVPDEFGVDQQERRQIIQFDKDEVEELGYIKFDFLRTDNLSILDETISLIKARTGETIEIEKIPDDDPEAFKIFQNTLLQGVFQFEKSDTAIELCTKLQPQSITDLSDITSLNRPGPLQAGLDQTYQQNKANNYPPSDMDPRLQKILERSYWTILYQEDVMNICSELGGFDLNKSDDVRRAMGKKKKEVLDQYFIEFKAGCIERGFTEKFAESIWKVLYDFADYCFTLDTKIMTNQGPMDYYQLTEAFLAGPVWIWSLNRAENKLELQPLMAIHLNGEQPVSEYTVNGHTIRCTDQHQILMTNGKPFSRPFMWPIKRLESIKHYQPYMEIDINALNA